MLSGVKTGLTVIVVGTYITSFGFFGVGIGQKLKPQFDELGISTAVNHASDYFINQFRTQSGFYSPKIDGTQVHQKNNLSKSNSITDSTHTRTGIVQSPLEERTDNSTTYILYGSAGMLVALTAAGAAAYFSQKKTFSF